MVRIRVTVTGDKNFLKKQIKNIDVLSSRQVAKMAFDTEKLFEQKINDSIERGGSTGNLSNTIFAEPILNGWGIGNITLLNEKAPYWRHVNFGSVAIGASHDHRVPTGGFSPGSPEPTSKGSGGRWNPGQDKFSFIPTKPIAPLNYIAKVLSEVDRVIQNGLRERI